jgi:hypothetical protein
MIRDVHPVSQISNPDLDFLLIPDTGSRVKKVPDPGSATLITVEENY